MMMSGTSDKELYNEWQRVKTSYHFGQFSFISNKIETYYWAP